MKLKDALEKQKPDRILYICSGTGALAGGTKDQIIAKIPGIERELQVKRKLTQETTANTYFRTKQVYGDDARRTKIAKKKYDQAHAPFIPLLERDVLNIYDRYSEEATNIKITGNEIGNVWSVKEGTEEWQKVGVNFNVENLIGAVLKTLVDDYKFAFRNEMIELKDCLGRLSEYTEQSRKWEREFFSEDLKKLMMVDPAYLIHETRRLVIEEINESERQILEKGGNHAGKDIT